MIKKQAVRDIASACRLRVRQVSPMSTATPCALKSRRFTGATQKFLCYPSMPRGRAVLRKPSNAFKRTPARCSKAIVPARKPIQKKKEISSRIPMRVRTRPSQRARNSLTKAVRALGNLHVTRRSIPRAPLKSGACDAVTAHICRT